MRVGRKPDMTDLTDPSDPSDPTAERYPSHATFGASPQSISSA